MEQKPKYLEICDWIKRKINAQELRPGERIYSENELMQIFSVSRQTVRHAISCLEFERLVVRKRGSGTYVSGSMRFQPSDRHGKQLMVVTTFIDEYIFPRIIKSIEKEVFEEGYSIQIASTHNSIETERMILSKLVGENMISGLVIEAVKSALPNPNISLYKELIRNNIPVVFLNAYYPELQVPHVSMDDRQAGKSATEYLIAKGHRHIGAIFKADDGQGHLRYMGYIEAMMEAGLEIDESNILWIVTGDIENMVNEKQRYLKRLNNVTACVCYNDSVASAFMNICLSSGISVPRDMSIMGIDDADTSKDLIVPLSTIHNPLQKLGKRSAEMIMKMMRGEEKGEVCELRGAVVDRESVVEYNSY